MAYSTAEEVAETILRTLLAASPELFAELR
jgi:hypothetical protein